MKGAIVESGGQKGVDQSFSSGGGEDEAEEGIVFEGEQGCLGDVTDVGSEGEGGVKDESKVFDLKGGGNCERVRSCEEGRRDLGPMSMIMSYCSYV